MNAPHWLALFALVLAGWTALFLMAMGQAVAPEGADLRTHAAMGADAAGLAGLWAMWGLMSAAMMLPTALPALATFDDLPGTGTDFARFAAGYLAVWIGFSALAAAAQLGLASAGVLDAAGASLSRTLSGGLLMAAGAYQFTALKAACLSKCRAPFAFFMIHWDEGPWRMGLRLGAVCLGCCWALMALAFVGGVMSLGFMALATVLMVFEKLPGPGAWLTRPLGYALLGGGAAVLAGF